MQNDSFGELIHIYTLVDITHTNDNNPRGNSLSFKQEQNYNTLLQVMSLRSQVAVDKVSLLKDQPMTSYDFGSAYKGLNDVWRITVKSEAVDIWRKDDIPLFYALHDCDSIPIYIGLDETANISSIIHTFDKDQRNVYFRIDSKKHKYI